MNKKEDLYIGTIRTKKYVQRYLELHYGCGYAGHPHLIDVSRDGELRELLFRMIKQPSSRRDSLYASYEGKKRNCIIELKLSRDTFNRYGWHLTPTDEVKFNTIIEHRCKKLLLDFLKLRWVLNDDLPTAIDEFYHECGYSERSWPSASITKIWSRNKAKLDLYSFKEEFSQLFNKLFMGNVSAKKDNLRTDLLPC